MPQDEVPLEAQTGPRVRGRISPLAALSLIMGFLALCPPAALAAVLFGLLARRSVRRSDGVLAGRTMALAGIGLGCVGTGVTAIAAAQMVPLYRTVTPVAERLLVHVSSGEWAPSYNLFSPEYRANVSVAEHQRRMGNLAFRAGEFRGLRWAYRMDPFQRHDGEVLVRVTYDARFANATRRMTFEFIQSGPQWLIHDFHLGT